MSIYEITFSPTGGTKKVTELLAENFSNEKFLIDLTKANEDYSDISFKDKDICIVSVPSYGGRVPDIAAKRLKKLSGNGAIAILIAVYGNRAFEDTLIELYDILSNCGFRCAAAISAIAEHSILRRFASGRPDGNDGKVMADFAEKIINKINSGFSDAVLSVPGNRPYKKYGIVPMDIEVSDSCIKCGICVKRCPVGAISADNPAETDITRCASCMRCVFVCPNNARYISEERLTVLNQKLEKICGAYQQNKLYI